ncbi:armadillo repeat-containing protein 3 [Tachysurus vachellii]|uniref:armadillo repeat-containing protein 3 n=1 Tax=Tachysurus vachellii TaxID=175792 RepID=UPI00296A9E49|nr:armadillo repeat-containing protein 3 [Tachysurus vachellii]
MKFGASEKFLNDVWYLYGNKKCIKTKCLYDRMGKKIKKEAEPQPKQGFEPLPIESKNAATVILMLQSPEEEVVVKAVEAIYKFAEKGDENKSSLMALGAVEPLTCLLKHDSKTVCKNAFMALGVLVSDKDVKRLIKKLNIIPSIITKLAPEEDITVHEFATLLLAHLSVDMTCKVQIFHNDGLKPLLTLLSSTDPDVKKQSVECIYNLVQEISSRVAVHTFNGIPPLLELLSSEFPIIQQFALRTLETINKDRDSRTAFREQNGFARILEFLTKKEFSDLHVEALKVISNCMEDTESMQLIQENGGLENLLQFLITPTAHDIQATAVETISKAAQSNGIRLIVQLLNSEGDRVKEVAAEALSSLTHANQPNAYAVYEAEGDKLLVQLLQNGSPQAVVHATAVLINMASQDVIRSRIISHGAIQALLKPLNSTDKPTLTNVTQAVAALTCDAEGRAELRSVGALPQLVNLLTSKDPDIRRNACWAVTVCANDEPTATEMCRLGALEILQEINSSLSRKNKFSEAALQRLLDSNLSLKYSLTGCLLSTDITTDGFYDPGQTKDGQRVPDLEDIAKQVINQRRAVIAVNGNPPDETITDSQEKGQQQSPTESQISTVMSSQGSIKTTSKSKAKGAQEDEIQSLDIECKPQEEAVVEKPWTLPYDAQLNNLIKETFRSVMPLHDEVEMYTALAKLVCDAMGGPIDIEQQYDFLWELHLSELKVEMQSNIIPIGKIKKGTYYHRALLFKVLSDRIGLSCSLVRGDYNRAWNEVLLPSTTTRATGLYPHLQTYIIDLMHKPGTLITCETPAAEQYQTI